MASPILKQLPPVQMNLSLGAFPGRPDDGRGEESCRIKCMVTITIQDRRTGERMQRTIPFHTNEAEELLPWMRLALEHDRTIQDVEAFSRGRNG